MHTPSALGWRSVCVTSRMAACFSFVNLSLTDFLIWILPSLTAKEKPQRQHTYVMLYIFLWCLRYGCSYFEFLRNTFEDFDYFTRIPNARIWAEDSVANALNGGLKRSLDLTCERGFVRSLCSDLLRADQRSYINYIVWYGQMWTVCQIFQG